MNHVGPIFDPATHYRIEVRSRVDVDWLQSFEGSVKISSNETWQKEDVTVLNVHADQAGIVGLVRRLHGLGLTILRLEIVSDGGKATHCRQPQSPGDDGLK